MVVVDSSVWVDYFNGNKTRETGLLDEFLSLEIVLIGDLIFTEVLQGFRDDVQFNRAYELLGTLLFEPMCGMDIAFASACYYRELRAKGVTIRKTIDMLIATFCIERGYSLLHSDRDFYQIQTHLNLRVI